MNDLAVDTTALAEPYCQFRLFSPGGRISPGHRMFCRAKESVNPTAILGSDVFMSATWRKHAACRGIDPDVFYPISDEESGEAKAICDQCAVRESCLEHALANREREGVWGGTTERERRRIHRQRRKSA